MRKRVVGAFASLALVGAVTACAPSAGPAGEQWTFRATNVTVNIPRDQVYLFDTPLDVRDEPYLMQIGFRVKLGVPNSARAFVVGSRGAVAEDALGAGESMTLTGAAQAGAVFNGVQPVDLLQLGQPDTPLEVIGTYTWAMERQLGSVDDAAISLAALMQGGLNLTLANGSIPDDPNVLLQFIVENITNGINIALANLNIFGLRDASMGGGLYIGVAATGALGEIINNVVPLIPLPQLELLGDNAIPPSIDEIGIFTMGPGRTFVTTFDGAGGRHTYTLVGTRTA